MISYLLVVLGIFGATLIPAYIALYLIPNLKQIPLRYIAAAGLGLTFWFFFDTMGDAGQLGENSSVASLSTFGGWPHVGVIVAFLLGITTLAIFDHFAVPRSSAKAGAGQNAGTILPSYSKMLFLIPAAVAAVMGIHGLAEGWDFATTASAPSTGSLTIAFGGLLSLVSYPIHKFLEASIIAAAYSCYVARTKISMKTASWQIPVLGLLFGGTSVIGAALGYYIPFDTTYFYAFGVTAALYATLRLVEPVSPRFDLESNPPMYLGGKLFLSFAIGFFLLYGAALLH